MPSNPEPGSVSTAGMDANLTESMPEVDDATAADLLSREYGIDAEIRALRGESDLNLMAVTGQRRLILKISHSAYLPEVVALENAAMAHVQRYSALPIPQIVTTLGGAAVTSLVAADGRRHLVRVLTVIEGRAGDEGPVAADFATQLGAVTAEMIVALAGFTDPAAGRPMDWDPRLVGRLRPMLTSLRSPDDAALIESLLDRLADLPMRVANLPSQVIHGDLTHSNVMVDPDGNITGAIDFGDVHHSARICEVAIALASMVRDSPDPFADTAEFLTGLQRILPLEPAEVAVLGELVLARLAASVLISAFRVELHPANADYITMLDDGSWRRLREWSEISPVDLADRLHRMTGTRTVVDAQLSDPSLLERRYRALGGTLVPLFYRQPLHLVRGAGPYLFDADGRRYLDGYNNVPVLGHSHPAVMQAVSRQSAVLSVNARYLHANLVELAERLLATMPATAHDGTPLDQRLDTCILMNSGSEANDLAWRLATHFTGAGGGLVSARAYHGVSEATSAMTSSTWPDGVRPDHVAPIGSPLPVDGVAPGYDDALAGVADGVAALAETGYRPALTIADLMFTNTGIVAPTAAYVHGLVDGSHRAGALFLADEVQAGYGRSGTHLWSFSSFGIVPDFVTLGKPMGNGYPVAALLTRREIVDAFVDVDEYFSTFGGNPVACAAALAVLDVIEGQGMVARAGRTGTELLTALRGLAARHPAIADVRGTGLIVGVEITPVDGAGVTAVELAERLKERGVLVGTTGPGDTVLKIRPPLVWGSVQVGELVAALDAALSEPA